MGKVAVDITMSLDGFVAGPDVGREHPLGRGGERLHEWAYDLEAFHRAHGRSGGRGGPDSEVLDEAMTAAGATVMGRRMFGGSDAPWGDSAWGDRPWEGWWGDEPPFHHPVFVLTHHPREPLMKGDTTFTFVTGGVGAAVEAAQAAAGDRDVRVAGGAETIQQCLAAGLVDEVQLHIAPLLLGRGARLFDRHADDLMALEVDRVVASPAVTHLRYRLPR